MDFEVDTTVTRPDKFTLNQALLRLWFDSLLPSLENWELKRDKGYDSGLSELKSIMKTMLWAIKSSMDKDLKKKLKTDFKTMRDVFDKLDKAQEPEEVYEMLEIIEGFLYSKGITKWDTKEVIDRTNVFKTNTKLLGGGY